MLRLALPGDDDPRRAEVRRWCADHPHATGRELAASGYVAPHWPRPWGLDADPVTQLIVDDELARAGIRRPDNRIGIGWAGPTILYAGSDAQKRRYLLPLLAGEEVWCQLFSEPDAGSDLASLSTRAVRDGDGYVVTGRKLWTSDAHRAQLGILLARTDPDAPQHAGISYFICPMDLPGVTVRPLRDLTGAHLFNEVTLDEVRLARDLLVGRENDGWRLARVTLANERVSLSGDGVLWGAGPTAADLVALVRRRGGLADPLLRQRLAAAYAEGEVLRVLGLRSVQGALAGAPPGPESSVRKALADAHGQRVAELAKDLAGLAGTLTVAGPPGSEAGDAEMWHFAFLFSRALTIGGGTAEVQRNLLGERVLGLAREPDVEAGRFSAKNRPRLPASS
jgi:alkylation response protein AidB-like acyl-CoA dehydrogenase